MLPRLPARSRFALALAVLLLGTAAPIGAALAGPLHQTDPVAELIGELMCPAEAARPLAASDAPEAVRMREFIRAKAAEGWSRERIRDTLVRQYGERILPVPSKEGFGLAAWATPFVIIFGGAGVLGLLLTRWLRERRRHDAYLMVEMVWGVDESDLRRYQTQLERDLEQFE